MQVNMHDAKSSLSKLVQLAAAGEDVVIARDGVPVARLVPYVEERRRRRSTFGFARDEIWMSPDWEDDVGIRDVFDESAARSIDP